MNKCAHINNSNLTFSLQGASIYKDECTKCYDNQLSTEGIDICLKCFNGGCRNEFFNHSKIHSNQKNHPIVLNLKMVQIKGEEKKEDYNKITKLAIGKKGGIDFSDETWQQWASVHCNICNVDIDHQSDSKLNDLVQSVINSASVQTQNKIEEWEEELFPCEHTLTLMQENNNKIASKFLAHCQSCNLSSNLWLCLTCGALGCGRRNYDGTGGNGHAIEHFKSTSHPLVVKTGTITPEGDASIYCYTCNNDVKDNYLVEHLINFGIDVKQQVKTEKTMTELNLDMNLNLTLSKIVEEGRILTKLYGPGFTGLENLGNSCYMSSVIQVLFSLEHFQIIYLDMALEHLNSCLNNPVDCYYCQICKLIYGVQSGMYSIKKTKVLPKVDDQSEEIEEYQDGIKPASFKNYFHKGNKEFSSGRQQDALEYLSYLLEKFERQEKMNGMPNPKSPFEFEIETRLECEDCHIVKYSKVTSFLLNLSIPNWESKKEKGSKVTLEECIGKFLAIDIVELDCPNCNKKSNFKKTQKINQYPAYLIVVFERFVYDWVPIKLDVDFVLPDDKTNFNQLSRPHASNNEKVIVEEAKKEEEEVDPEFNQNALNELIMNGIPELAAKHALLNTGNNNAEDAMNWYFMNMESSEINQPIKKIKKSTNVPSEKKANVNPSLVKDLVDMGFTQKRAEFALLKCNNDMERACDYLFSHMEDEDVQPNNDVGNKNPNIISKYTDTSKNSSVYSLYSFITHLGANTHAGHYVSHIFKNNNWVLFNDSKVALTNDPPISKAYIYFFKNISI